MKEGLDFRLIHAGKETLWVENLAKPCLILEKLDERRRLVPTELEVVMTLCAFRKVHGGCGCERRGRRVRPDSLRWSFKVKALGPSRSRVQPGLIA